MVIVVQLRLLGKLGVDTLLTRLAAKAYEDFCSINWPLNSVLIHPSVHKTDLRRQTNILTSKFAFPCPN